MNDKLLKWSVYEANVQQYRVIFLTSQTFLLAVGAILFSKNHSSTGLILFISAIALLQIWYIWFIVIRVRTFVVDYYKFQIEGWDKKGELEAMGEAVYRDNRKERKKINKSLGKRNMRLTRFKIDLLLPVTISLIWIVLIFLVVCN